MPKYEVKNVKSFIGREGYGFNASLYRDGKKVAFVYDMADGGPTRYDWEDRKEEAILDAYAAAQPQHESPYTPGKMYDVDADHVMSRLVDNFDIAKKLKAQLKKKTLYVFNGNCYNMAIGYTPSIADALAAKHPGSIALNKLPFDEALGLYIKYAVKD